MIELSGEPTLGSLALTREASLKYTYKLPQGMLFPADAEASLKFTDRAGGEYDFSPHEGELSEDFKSFVWQIDSNVLDHIPAGANFEVFVTFDDFTYKVRYGRVVRKEAAFPLSPLANVDPPPLMYEDDMQRSMPGPRWINKFGRVSMHDRGDEATPQWAMASRNAVDIFGAGLNLWQNAAVLWYAPMQSDTIEMSVGLLNGNAGRCTIVLCSNYAMTSFIGVRFDDPLGGGTDTVQAVTGSAWDETATVGSAAGYNVPSNGGVYKITYSLTSNTVSVTSPAGGGLISTVISTSVPHGAGYRYIGAIWEGSLVSTGPKLYYLKAKDAV